MGARHKVVATRPRRGVPLPEVVWAGARDEYVCEGKLTYAAIATRLGVAESAVEKHALNRDANGGKTWAEWRRDFNDAVGIRSRDRIKDVQVQARIEQARSAIEAGASHRALLQKLRVRLETKILGNADSPESAIAAALDTIEGRDALKLLLDVIAMERKTYGMDRVAGEDAGRDGDLDAGTRETVIRIAAAAGPADGSIATAARALVEVSLGRRARAGA